MGKTALVRRFVLGRPHLYFLANRLPEREQLLHPGEVTGRFFADPLLEENGFPDWRQVFSYRSRREERYDLVVDEWLADRILGELDQHVTAVYAEICAQVVREGSWTVLPPGATGRRSAGGTGLSGGYEIGTEIRLPILLPG